MPSSTTNRKVVVVIPARMASNRLPGKPLLPIAGKPMLQHTYDAAKKTCASSVVVATSDNEIVEYCTANDISCIRTSQKPVTGTHRVAEAVEDFFQRGFRGDELVVNIQCDEPFFNPKDVNDLVQFYKTTTDTVWFDANREAVYGFDICTIAACHGGMDAFENSNVTKVVVTEEEKQLQAHWFSRASLAGALFHCGIYIYTSTTVQKLGELKPTTLSKAESLEQLAWIEDGYVIGTLIIDNLPKSINTKEDYKAVVGKTK